VGGLTICLVACVAVQLLPARWDIPLAVKAVQAAAATSPAQPPPAVNPTSTMRVVGASGPTEAPAEITKDTVWGPQGSPYIVRGMSVQVGASLTLLPGTVVKIDWQQSIRVSGQLLALGTPTGTW
jgi:hypothetical protein